MTVAARKTLFAQGFDHSIYGYVDDAKVGCYRIVYAKHRMIEELIIRDDMSLDEATEYLEHNVWNAYMGDGTPIYVDVMPDRKDIEDYLLIDNQ